MWFRTAGLLSAGAAVALLSGAPALAKSSVRVLVGPQMSFEPASVRITSLVEPDASNRSLVVEVDSGAHYSRSEVPLEGAEAPRSQSMWLKNLPAGQYLVTVAVFGETGPVSRVTGTFTVVSAR